MKKRYQIDREKAVRRFESQAARGDGEVQLHLPLKQIASALQEGVGELMRQAGLELDLTLPSTMLNGKPGHP